MASWTLLDSLISWASSEQQIQIFAACGASLVRSWVSRDSTPKEALKAMAAAILAAFLAREFLMVLLGESERGIRLHVILVGLGGKDWVDLADLGYRKMMKNPSAVIDALLKRLGLERTKKDD